MFLSVFMVFGPAADLMILHYFPIVNYYFESRYNNNEWNFNILYTLETLYKRRGLGYTFLTLSVLQIRRGKGII